MPYYDYECSDCRKKFDIYRSIKIKSSNILCPKCGSHNTRQIFKSVPSVSIAGLPRDRFK
jgi:putative FmdB family regulatory protein